MRTLSSGQNLALSLLAILIYLAGCSGSGPVVKKHAYINARLSFSISYHEGWLTRTTPTTLPGFPDSVLWTLADENLHNGRLELAVVALPLRPAMSPDDRLKNILFEAYPNFTLHASKAAHLPVGPCNIYDGYTPHQSFRIWSIPSNRYRYLLIGASSPERFANNLTTFEAIAESFRPLDYK